MRFIIGLIIGVAAGYFFTTKMTSKTQPQWQHVEPAHMTDTPSPA